MRVTSSMTMTSPGAPPHRRPRGPSSTWGGVFLWAALLLTGCAELEPMVEPETIDLELMVSSLQGALRESERTMADLRAELEGRRQDLSAAVVARAQLEGRLREVERRLTEARHIIDLQRDELLFSRTERDRALPSRSRRPSKFKSAPKPQPHSLPSAEGNGAAPPAFVPPPVPPPATDGGQDLVPSQDPQESGGDGSAGGPSPHDPVAPVSAVVPDQTDSSMGTFLSRVAVQAGDTLYSLARRYRVSLTDLRTANGLKDDRILVGQALLLPPPRDRASR